MTPKKLLLTGVNGQVGHALNAVLSAYEVIGLSRDALNLQDAQQIDEVVTTVKPDLIINPAAYTAVDRAESEKELAFKINAEAPAAIAKAAEKVGAALIHFSTDYVYDGDKASAYIEADAVNPKGVYGASKLAGEQAIIDAAIPHLIFRTSWVYGDYGKNFLKTILHLAQERETLRIVADQFGAPTSSLSIADAVLAIIQKWDPENLQTSGVYHMTNAGRTSWHGFAAAFLSIYEKQHMQPALKLDLANLQAIPASEYPTPAARPKNSCLDNQKLQDVFGVRLPTWQDALQVVMDRLK